MTLDTVMIFAAGRGTRMRELTDRLPKPLIQVCGKPLIDHALDLADAAGIRRKLINTHYLGHLLADHMKARDDVMISHEKDGALETGGGLKHALGQLDRDVVLTLNPDIIWSGANPLTNLRNAWQPNKMAALLMLVPLENATGHKYSGDFNIDETGRVSRHSATSGKAYVYTGAQVLQTRQVREISDTRFSFNVLWDQLIAQGRLFGAIHSGGWADVGSPEGIDLAQQMMQSVSDV
ncbi:MAG: MurNAc alpha-1-phosphate uridylyltransferase [Paracoccaceae bacterium]|jgi:MurNAc alpha-1-phosphate uridylyltransferase